MTPSKSFLNVNRLQNLKTDEGNVGDGEGGRAVRSAGHGADTNPIHK